jgi:hypothetical protein
MDLLETSCECGRLMELAQDCVQWRTLVLLRFYLPSFATQCISDSVISLWNKLTHLLQHPLFTFWFLFPIPNVIIKSHVCIESCYYHNIPSILHVCIVSNNNKKKRQMSANSPFRSMQIQFSCWQSYFSLYFCKYSPYGEMFPIKIVDISEIYILCHTQIVAQWVILRNLAKFILTFMYSRWQKRILLDNF